METHGGRLLPTPLWSLQVHAQTGADVELSEPSLDVPLFAKGATIEHCSCQPADRQLVLITLTGRIRLNLHNADL